MVNIAINGFGRIGRLFLRALSESKYNNILKIKMINDLADLKTNIHLFKYDSIHGTFNKRITQSKNSFAELNSIRGGVQGSDSRL